MAGTGPAIAPRGRGRGAKRSSTGWCDSGVRDIGVRTGPDTVAALVGTGGGQRHRFGRAHRRQGRGARGGRHVDRCHVRPAHWCLPTLACLAGRSRRGACLRLGHGGRACDGVDAAAATATGSAAGGGATRLQGDGRRGDACRGARRDDRGGACGDDGACALLALFAQRALQRCDDVIGSRLGLVLECVQARVEVGRQRTRVVRRHGGTRGRRIRSTTRPGRPVPAAPATAGCNRVRSAN